jgi:hypothetical protein
VPSSDSGAGRVSSARWKPSEAAYAPYTGAQTPQEISPPPAIAAKVAEEWRNPPKTAGYRTRTPGRRRSAAPGPKVYADSLTNRPMRAYFSGFCARIVYAYAIETTGTATPMIPSHETGTENVPEPMVKSSLT